MVTDAGHDAPRVVTVFACFMCAVIITATIVTTVDALRTGRELRSGARALRGNFDGHQCAPAVEPEIPQPPAHTEN